MWRTTLQNKLDPPRVYFRRKFNDRCCCVLLRCLHKLNLIFTQNLLFTKHKNFRLINFICFLKYWSHSNPVLLAPETNISPSSHQNFMKRKGWSENKTKLPKSLFKLVKAILEKFKILIRYSGISLTAENRANVGKERRRNRRRRQVAKE